MTAYRLLIVETAHRTGFGLQLEPKVLLRDISSVAPDALMPAVGDEVELQRPDGETGSGYISAFGIEAWKIGDKMVTASDPKDPALTLSLAGDLSPEDVPAGTEIWLTPRQRS